MCSVRPRSDRRADSAAETHVRHDRRKAVARSDAAGDDVAELVLPQRAHGSSQPCRARADFLSCPRPRACADHFLQRDDVGVDVAQHLDDARRRLAIHPAAPVRCGRDPDLGHCCRSGSDERARSSPREAGGATSDVTSSLRRDRARSPRQARRDLGVAHRGLSSSLCSNDRLSMLVVPTPPTARRRSAPWRASSLPGTRRCGCRRSAAGPTCGGSQAAPSADRCAAPAR